MSSNFIKNYILFACLLCTTACSHLNSDSDKSTYYDSAYNDHNRAPASVTPQINSENGNQKIDQYHLHTQGDYYFSLGEAYSLDGKHEKAIESFKNVLIYDPGSSQVSFRIASEFVKLGLITEAVENAELAVKKDAKNIQARILLGGLYSSLKDYTNSIKQYEAALKIDENNTDAPLYLGAVYAEQKQFDKSVKYFESLAKNEDFSSPYLAYYYIGRVRMEQASKGSYKAAEAAFKKSLNMKPSSVEVITALGSLYQKLDQEEKTIDIYKNFQKEHGPSAKVAETLSQIYMEKENYDAAYEQLEILENTEDTLNVKVKMALILIEQKRFNVAILKLQDVLKQVPDSDKIQFYLAAIYEEIDNKEMAVEYFKKIQNTSSFYSEAVVHAAYLLKSLKKTDDAVALVKQAYESSKEIPQIIAVYASLLDETKDFKTAQSVLNEGLKKFPDSVQLMFFMGTIQDRLGNKEQVVANMQNVIQLDPNHVQSLNYLAFTYAESNKNLEEAEKLARRALQFEPKDGFILDTLGWILFKKGQFSDSIKVLESAHQAQPNESVIAEHLGDAYHKHQLIDKAKKMYQRAAEVETDSNKQKEIRSKISAIEKQEFSNRAPASIGP